VPVDPLEALTDDDLYQTQLVLRVGCGRNRSVLKDKHRTRICFLASLLDLEADKRGRPSPKPPFSL
jgi:hypothetical protein